MAELQYNKPVVTRDAYLKIDGLKVGNYRFQLRVYDDGGNVSRPDVINVRVAYRTITVPVVTVDPIPIPYRDFNPPM